MLNIDSQDWWRWQMYRAAAEFMHSPGSQQEARLKFFMTSYRYFHPAQNAKSAQNNQPQAPLCLGNAA